RDAGPEGEDIGGIARTRRKSDLFPALERRPRIVDPARKRTAPVDLDSARLRLGPHPAEDRPVETIVHAVALGVPMALYPEEVPEPRQRHGDAHLEVLEEDRVPARADRR